MVSETAIEYKIRCHNRESYPRMRIPILAAAIATLVCSIAAGESATKIRDTQTPVNSWPTITRENKPATRWWWMGNAVNAADLTSELRALHAAGFGGVEITPIYGVKGYESQ